MILERIGSIGSVTQKYQEFLIAFVVICEHLCII